VNSEASFGAGLGVGRTCPLDYCYQPTVFARGADFTADVLYVVGGLYGNLAAIDELEALASTEQASVTFVFNGDFHWFDADRKWFDDVETRLSRYGALRGNVETEISRMRDIGAGCGCAYPPTVDDLTVRRSNQILGVLKFVAQGRAATCDRLSHRPLYGTLHKGAHIDAIALDYDQDAFSEMFLSRWPNESPAFLSYFDRIANGAAYDIARARPSAVTHHR
jgi:hypothetical protein